MKGLKNEQREAVMHGEGNIIISASAGSGKTFVMIERLIRLISEKKAGVKDMLAVTFTEAAASEMKEKLKKALVEKINGGAAFLAEELTEVAAADICTLHSFCSRLLRQYFFTAGISPDFRIADGDRAAALKKESADKTFKQLYKSGDADFLRIAERYRRKRSDEKFKSLILSLHAYCESEVSPSAFMEKYAENYSEAGFLRIKTEYEAYLDKELFGLLARAEETGAECDAIGFKKGADFCAALVSDLKALMNGGLYDVKKYANYALPALFGRGLSEDAVALKNRAVGVRDDFKAVLKRFNRHLTDEESDKRAALTLYEHTAALVKTLSLFSENYAAAKRDENLLDFADLEHFTLAALDNDEVRQAVQSKYKYVFADEYQDVNGVQEEILSRVSDGNLFMVGDVKQSIYGFRGCRPEIFGDKFERMKKGGEKAVLLNCNFRSSAAVINAVNEIFSYSMTPEYAGLDYKNTSALVPGGVYPENAPGRFEAHLLKNEKTRSTEKEEPRIYDVLEEARKRGVKQTAPVSALITEIINGELGKEYYAPKEKKFKKITFSDITVLTRNKNNAYIAGLVSGLIKRGVPVVSEVKQNACDFPEIAALIAALKLTDNFYQDVPLVTVLLSPVGGFTEEELAEAALYYSDNFKPSSNSARGGFSAAFAYYIENADTPLKGRFKAFCEYFEKVRFISDFTGARGVLDRLIEDCGYENCLLASSCGETKTRRLHGFLAAAVKEGGSYTVKEFLEKIQTAGEDFAVSEAAEEDAVRVMTIHASKGLEFPVTVVCGLERKSNSEEEREEILTDREFGIAVRLFDDAERTAAETLLRGLIREKMRENRLKEELRLFYVATTRAGYSLHLTFEGKDDLRKEKFCGAERFLDYVPATLPVTEWDKDSFEFTDFSREKRKVLIGEANECETQKMKKDFSFRYPFESDTVLPLKGNVTAANALMAQEFYPVHILFGGEDVPDKEGGVTAHKIVENYDFSRGDFYKQVEDMVASGVLSRESIEKVSLERIKKAAEAAFGSLEGYDLYREQPFMAEAEAGLVFKTDSKEKVLLQGVIDLLALKDGKAVIVDYKYSSLNAESLKKRYGGQLSLYAYAAEKILGVETAEKRLVNLFTGETVKL